MKIKFASASTDGAWESANITTSGGSFLWCCNGVDKARYYDGSTWVVLDGASSPALTGVTSTDISGVMLFKSRLIFTLKDSLSFGFLAVNSVAGAVSSFPLGAIFTKGGYIEIATNWTLDAGAGIDDYMVFITSEGEAAVYQGTDPAVAANWALVGVYFIGKPLSNRSYAKVGGDVIVLTSQGVYPLSKALGFATSDETAAISYKIQTLLLSYIAEGESLFGWSVNHFPDATMLIINAPFRSSTSLNFFYSYQFVMNTTNLSWARFTNMASEAWAVHGKKLYFAAHNKINQAWVGQTDDGELIKAKVQTAFSFLSRSRVIKHVTLLRPIISASGSLTLKLGIETDFSVDVRGELQPPSSSALSVFDSAIYDISTWSGSSIDINWKTVSNNPGRWVALVMEFEAKATISWYSTDFIYETGTFL